MRQPRWNARKPWLTADWMWKGICYVVCARLSSDLRKRFRDACYLCKLPSSFMSARICIFDAAVVMPKGCRSITERSAVMNTRHCTICHSAQSRKVAYMDGILEQDAPNTFPWSNKSTQWYYQSHDTLSEMLWMNKAYHEVQGSIWKDATQRKGKS